MKGESPRNMELYRRISGGEATREVAASIGISRDTARQIVLRIKAKMEWEEAERRAWHEHARRQA